MKINFNRAGIMAKVKNNVSSALSKCAEGVKADLVQGLSIEQRSQPGDLFPGKDTGDLQASVKIDNKTDNEKPKVIIYTDSPYAHALEYGARIQTGHGEIYIAPRPGWRHTFAEWKPKIIQSVKSAIRQGFK